MRILMVSSTYPNDTSFGAGQRTTLMHRALKQMGEVASLVLLEGEGLQYRPEPAPEVAAEITYPARGLFNKYGEVPEIAELVDRAVDLNSFDLVVGRHPPPLLALRPFRGLAMVDADDGYYRHPRGRIPLASELVASMKDLTRLKVNRAALMRVDHVWLSCERDMDQLRLPSASILPNVIEVLENTTDVAAESEDVILFVGALWYRPNHDAIDWFISQCWPALWQKFPNARFRIVGAAPAETRNRWGNVPGVECPGFVDDLAVEYRRARAAIVPIQAGGGTQIKTLEALAHGRVPVVSSFVARGFKPHLQPGQSLVVADTAAEMIDRLQTMLGDASAWRSIAANGRDVVGKVFSYARFEKAVHDAIVAHVMLGGSNSQPESKGTA